MFGTIDNMLRDAAGVTDHTYNGECSNCGECCSDFLPVSPEDVRRIHRFVKQHNIKEHKNVVLQADFDVTCPFRDNVHRVCTIYPVRPGICREFKCDYSPTKLSENKEYFHRRYDIISMRQEFFGHQGAQEVLASLQSAFMQALVHTT
jgi:Fe-S-cluster containining protein